MFSNHITKTEQPRNNLVSTTALLNLNNWNETLRKCWDIKMSEHQFTKIYKILYLIKYCDIIIIAITSIINWFLFFISQVISHSYYQLLPVTILFLPTYYSSRTISFSKRSPIPERKLNHCSRNFHVRINQIPELSNEKASWQQTPSRLY